MEDLNIWYDELTKHDIHINPEQKTEIEHRINEILTYEPHVGVLGKTGVGKSSLCNALFGQNICQISDVEACTRNAQEVILNMGGKGLKLIDVPGIGENLERDSEYSRLYAELLPKMDLVLWLIKADERALSSDEAFFNNIIKPHIEQNKPFFIVISQSEKIEPLREWNIEENEPGPNQLTNLEHKAAMLSKKFGIPHSHVISISSKEKYNLIRLVNEIVYALPREKNVTFYRAVNNELKTQQTGTFVEEGFMQSVAEIFSTVAVVGKEIFGLVKKAWTFFKGFLGF